MPPSRTTNRNGSRSHKSNTRAARIPIGPHRRPPALGIACSFGDFRQTRAPSAPRLVPARGREDRVVTITCSAGEVLASVDRRQTAIAVRADAPWRQAKTLNLQHPRCATPSSARGTRIASCPSCRRSKIKRQHETREQSHRALAEAGHEQRTSPAGRMVWMRRLRERCWRMPPRCGASVSSPRKPRDSRSWRSSFIGAIHPDVIGVILLPDSHLTIHTSPREHSVTLDVFVGTQERNNRAKARAVYGLLKDGFQARQGKPAADQSRRSRALRAHPNPGRDPNRGIRSRC